MRWQNIGTLDRSARFLVGVVLLAAVLLYPSVLSDLLIVVGLFLVATGISGYCPLYRIVHFSTRRKQRE